MGVLILQNLKKFSVSPKYKRGLLMGVTIIEALCWELLLVSPKIFIRKNPDESVHVDWSRVALSHPIGLIGAKLLAIT